MVRNTPWRRSISDACSWHQDEALNSRLLILHQTGPYAFVLRERNTDAKFRVCLGDPHSCTCKVYLKERDLCKHICWLLLRKYKVDRYNELSFQLGLVDRELEQIVSETLKQIETARESGETKQNHVEKESSTLAQKEIEDGDVCPICQEDFLIKNKKREPVTYCRRGCGQNIHIHCMKVWCDHQKSINRTIIECPLCRADFGNYSQLLEEYKNSLNDQRLPIIRNVFDGLRCNRCSVTPIKGNCYKCSECDIFYLCQDCFSTQIHLEHPFVYKSKVNQRWLPSQRPFFVIDKYMNSNNTRSEFESLANRELTDNDYELLLQLDAPTDTCMQTSDGSSLTEATVGLIPCLTLKKHHRHFFKIGVQCGLCLRPYQIAQPIRRLPCMHKFHKYCLDSYLLHTSRKCPTCQTEVTVESLHHSNKPPSGVKSVKRNLAEKPETDLLSLLNVSHNMKSSEKERSRLSQSLLNASRLRTRKASQTSLNLDSLVLEGKQCNSDFSSSSFVEPPQLKQKRALRSCSFHSEPGIGPFDSSLDFSITADSIVHRPRVRRRSLSKERQKIISASRKEFFRE